MKIKYFEDKLEVEFDGCEVDSLDSLITRCLSLKEVKDFNPGSDYTEQYYTIEVFAETVKVIFRKEPQRNLG